MDSPATAMVRSGRGQTSHLERNFLRLWRDSPVLMFFLMVLACFGNYKVLEASLLFSVLGKAQFHLIPTASKKLVDAPFQSLVHILQQPSCNDETLLTSLALDVEFFVQLNFYSPNLHSQIPLKILWTNPIATVPEGG